jgi:hypothetical protein
MNQTEMPDHRPPLSRALANAPIVQPLMLDHGSFARLRYIGALMATHQTSEEVCATACCGCPPQLCLVRR